MGNILWRKQEETSDDLISIESSSHVSNVRIANLTAQESKFIRPAVSFQRTVPKG